MAFFITCPKCDARLRTATQLPAGRVVTCASCQRSFTTRAAAQAESSSRRRKADENEIPGAELIDDEEDDDRPMPRRRRNGDDRPPSRNRRPDEPRRSKRPASKKRRSPALIVALGLVAFVFLLGIGVLLVVLLSDSSKPAGSDLLVHAPIDAVILSGYDLDSLNDNEAFRRSLERRSPPDLVELDRAGLRSIDLSQVLVARTVNNGYTCAVRFRSPPEKSKYLQADVSGKSYAPFTSLTGNYRFGYFADDRTLVLADKEQAIQALRDKGRARLPGHLQLMVDKVRGPVWRASGRISNTEFNRMGPLDDGFSLKIGPSAGTAAWLVPGGRMADVQFELEFENVSQARQAVANLKSAFLLQLGTNEYGQLMLRDGTDPADASDIRKGYQNADVSNQEKTVTAKLVLPASEALRAVGSVRY